MGLLAPTLLLIGRLGRFSVVWRGFYGRYALQRGHEQPTGFGVGLALGFELVA
jgi:hypothetical protein